MAANFNMPRNSPECEHLGKGMKFAKSLLRMEHYIISTNCPGFNRTLLALTRQDKHKQHRFYYDLYQVGHFLGSIFPAVNRRGQLVWEPMHQMDRDFVALIGNQLLKKGI